MNPPLYAWRHNEFKRKFKNVFLKCWRCCLRQKLKLLRKSSSNTTFSTHSLPRNEAHAGNDENGLNTHSVEEVNHKLLKIPWKLYQWSTKFFTHFSVCKIIATLKLSSHGVNQPFEFSCRVNKNPIRYVCMFRSLDAQLCHVYLF